MKDGLKLRDVLLMFAADCLVALAPVSCMVIGEANAQERKITYVKDFSGKVVMKLEKRTDGSVTVRDSRGVVRQTLRRDNSGTIHARGTDGMQYKIEKADSSDFGFF